MAVTKIIFLYSTTIIRDLNEAKSIREQDRHSRHDSEWPILLVIIDYDRCQVLTVSLFPPDTMCVIISVMRGNKMRMIVLT